MFTIYLSMHTLILDKYLSNINISIVYSLRGDLKMNIEFNRGLSRVHDAMEGLVYCYKDNYKHIYEEYNLSLNKAAEEAFVFIKERITMDIANSDLFFSRETGAAITFARSRFIPSDLSVDNFVDYLIGLSDEEVKLIVLSNLNSAGPKISHEELILISQDGTRIMDFLRNIKLSSSIKWEALEFFRDVRSSMKGFIELVKRYIPIYKKILSRNKKLIETFENYVESGINSEGEVFFTKLVKDSIRLDAEEIIIGTLFFRSRTLICTIVGEKLYIFIGMDYEETVRLSLGAGDASISVFKNVSDKTRFQILNLLKDKDLYGQEIADKVGITLATVSYHMNYLLASNLVTLEKVGQKGYYSLRKDTLKKSVDFLNNNFNL